MNQRRKAVLCGVGYLLRSVLALVWTTAALGKAQNPAQLVEEIQAAIGSLGWLVAPAIVGLELTIAASIALIRLPLLASICSSVLLAVFTVYAIQQPEKSCSCFGAVNLGTLSSGAVVRNVTLLALSSLLSVWSLWRIRRNSRS